MQKLKKILGFLLFLIVLQVLRPAYAESPAVSPQNNISVAYKDVNPDVPKDLNTLTQSTIIHVLTGSVCLLSGRDPLNPINGKCLGIDTKSGKIGYVAGQGGMAKVMGNLIGASFVIPVSGSDYAQYALNNFGITKKTYAQEKQQNGLGFSRLTPLVGIWARFRDIAYLVFVLAFTVIGLAIMFRVKIDARTVMTIQNQIPKIVIALILVTFSYAIAGFLIDMMYVLMFLVILTFSSLNPAQVNTHASIFNVVNKVMEPGAYNPGPSGIISLTYSVSSNVGSMFSSLAIGFLESTISSLFEVFFIPLEALNLGCNVFGFFSSWITIPGLLQKIPGVGDLLGHIPGFDSLFGGSSCDFVKTFFETAFTVIFGIIVFLVVLIAILYSLFRAWFTIIKSFAYILVDAMVAPLWITAGVFPGSKLNFTSWIRHISGHLSVFPMTFGVILLGKTIMDAVGSGQGQLFSPPLIGDAISGNTTVASFIGLAFIISIPSILDRTRKAIGAIDFGLVDIRRSFGAGAKMGTGGFQAATSREIEYGKDGEGKYVPQPIGRGRKLAKGLGIIR